MKAKQPNRRAAIEGESYRTQGSNKVFVVQPKSSGVDGRWICMTCGLALLNNFEKDTHCHGRAKTSRMLVVLGPPARHVLAWLSFTSRRLEVP